MAESHITPYKSKMAGVAYFSFLAYEQGNYIYAGFIHRLNEAESEENNYRGVTMRFNLLIYSLRELIIKIDPMYFQDDQSNFLRSQTSLLMELSCKRVYKM